MALSSTISQWTTNTLSNTRTTASHKVTQVTYGTWIHGKYNQCRICHNLRVMKKSRCSTSMQRKSSIMITMHRISEGLAWPMPSYRTQLRRILCLGSMRSMSLSTFLRIMTWLKQECLSHWSGMMIRQKMFIAIQDMGWIHRPKSNNGLSLVIRLRMKGISCLNTTRDWGRIWDWPKMRLCFWLARDPRSEACFQPWTESSDTSSMIWVTVFVMVTSVHPKNWPSVSSQPRFWPTKPSSPRPKLTLISKPSTAQYMALSNFHNFANIARSLIAVGTTTRTSQKIKTSATLPTSSATDSCQTTSPTWSSSSITSNIPMSLKMIAAFPLKGKPSSSTSSTYTHIPTTCLSNRQILTKPQLMDNRSADKTLIQT